MIAWPGFLCHQVPCYLNKHVDTNREFPTLWEQCFTSSQWGLSPQINILYILCNYCINLVSVKVDVKIKNPHSHHSDRNISGMHLNRHSCRIQWKFIKHLWTPVDVQHNRMWNSWLNQEFELLQAIPSPGLPDMPLLFHSQALHCMVAG